MASIKKLPNGTYQATIYAGRDANGKFLRKYVTKPTLKECKAAAREIEQELEDGKFIHVGNTRVTAWVDKWLEINKERLSPSTYALYKTYQKLHYTPFFNRFKLNQLSEIHIKEFMNSKQKDLTNASVRRIMSTLKRILEDALKHKSPARDIKLPKAEKYQPKVLTENEMQLIHNAVKGTRDEPIILLAAWCGLRRGEIFALKWNDVNWKEGTLRVDESYCITEECEYVDKRPKSENGLRQVVVPEYLLGLLENLRKPKEKKKKKGQENIVELNQGKDEKADHRIFDMRPDSYSSYFAELVREKELPQIRFHDLRHYHASWLYARGIPDQYAAQRLGHGIQILKTIYQHLGLDRKTEIDDNIRHMHDNPKVQEDQEKAPE